MSNSIPFKHHMRSDFLQFTLNQDEKKNYKLTLRTRFLLYTTTIYTPHLLLLLLPLRHLALTRLFSCKVPGYGKRKQSKHGSFQNVTHANYNNIKTIGKWCSTQQKNKKSCHLITCLQLLN